MFKNLRHAVKGLCLAAALSVGLIPVAPAAPAASAQGNAKPPLKVGFVFVSPVGEAGWSYQHNHGRLEMEQRLAGRVATTMVENVAEGPESERVIRDLAQQGHGLIFTTSFGYMDPTLKVAAEFPRVTFEHMGGYKWAPNVATYNARFYEGRYLAGIVAGRMSKRGTAGYVAGFPVPEVVQGINAFTLGMRSVNPKARVRVVWLNNWFDPARERDAALTLIRQGADVITHHSASPAAVQAAEEQGVMSIPYHSDMRQHAPRGQLTAVTHHWGDFYTRIAQDVLDGRWAARPAWGGLKDGMVRLAPFSRRVPADTVKLVQARAAAISSGAFHPFSGRIVDNQGRQRQAAGVLDEAGIATMDYYVEGVVGSFPRQP
ncbi:BMP family ABC transporter substrate-binding protein [Caldimonas brevitalea]|uniref:Simple sugar transport system substrate-binding protein n=1 Tax=Caldimonas brevitalea TaxID=413882 RepID=A0A0G3BJ66_9BURK|nr:BMP family ABC transporter substrate-binding protein [Caldimonas brevitalea]AKJ28038.1 simple sugar transport system substrate-binding protein [Caldimonas brevitalea]